MNVPCNARACCFVTPPAPAAPRSACPERPEGRRRKATEGEARSAVSSARAAARREGGPSSRRISPLSSPPSPGLVAIRQPAGHPAIEKASENGRTEKHPPFVPDSGHGLSGGELGRPPPGPPLARWARVRGSIRDPRLSARWARPTWKSTAHRSVLLAPIARSLCNRNARGRAWRMCRSAATSVD